MKQRQFETTLYLEKKEAKKVSKAIRKKGMVGGFVEAEGFKSHLALNNFRIVVYHEDLKQVVATTLNRDHIQWIEKHLTANNND